MSINDVNKRGFIRWIDMNEGKGLNALEVLIKVFRKDREGNFFLSSINALTRC